MPSSSARAQLQLVFCLVIFGTIGLFVRHIDLPSGVIAFGRSAIGALFLLCVKALRRERLDRDAIRKNLKLLLPAGAMLGFGWIGLFEAYRFTSVAVATVCYYLAPIFLLLLSPLLFGERLSAPKCGCAAAALCGCFLLSGVLQAGPSAGVFDPRGMLFAIGAAAFYAAIVACSKRMKDISALDITITELAVAALVMLVYVPLSVDLSALRPNGLSLALLAVLGIFHTGIAYRIYFSSIAVLPAQTTALFSYIDPVVSVLLSVLWLREPLNALSAIGVVLVLVSAAASELLPQKPPRDLPDR